MGKMNELSMVLDEMKKCGEMLIQISEDLKQLFSTPSDTAAVTATAKAETKTTVPQEPPKVIIKKEQVRAVLAQKSRDGFTKEVKEILKKYGANKLSEVKESDYQAVLQDVEVLGNG